MTPEKMQECLEDLDEAQAVIARQKVVILVVSLLSGLLLAAASFALIYGGGLLGHTLRASPQELGGGPAKLFLPSWFVEMKVS